ncbi:hypothetical protein L3Q82_010340, partial [Scortum barcoo]
SWRDWPSLSPAEATGEDVFGSFAFCLSALHLGVDDAVIYLLQASPYAFGWWRRHCHSLSCLGSVLSDVVSDTGAPQGTVLSPFLLTLYTTDFQYNSESCHLQKFSDDSAVVECIREGE